MPWSSARRRWRSTAWAATTRKPASSRLHEIQQLAPRVDQRRQGLAAIAAAAVDGEREGAGARPLMGVVVAPHHAQELAVRMVQLREAGAAPPEAVALGRERPLRIQAGMDEEQALVVGIGGAAGP